MGNYCCYEIKNINLLNKSSVVVDPPSPRVIEKNEMEDKRINIKKFENLNKENKENQIIENKNNEKINTIKKNDYENQNQNQNLIFINEYNIDNNIKIIQPSNSPNGSKKDAILDLDAADIFEILPENSNYSREFIDFDSSSINSLQQINSDKENKSENYLKVSELIRRRSILSNNSNSNSNRNSSNIFRYSDHETSLRILDEINEARISPLEFSKKVKKYSKYIFEDESRNKSYLSIYTGNERAKVYLKENKNTFLKTIDILEELPEKMKTENYKLEKLIPLDDLLFSFSASDKNRIDDFEYIDICIAEIQNKIKGKYKLKAFHYFISFIDIEPLCVLHIVDDCNFNKTIQRAIFNPEVKYVGINFCKIDEGVYIVYFIYAI
jgi:hypothetical protein